jgi:hypothetical protein
MPPYLFAFGRLVSAMIEILFMAQLVRNPLQALARHARATALRGMRRPLIPAFRSDRQTSGVCAGVLLNQ